MYDVLIKGGTVIDGSGGRAFTADVAVSGGKIACIAANIDEDAKDIIDATGLSVTPGFIDPHTHYDGQATWDKELAPSSWHGVTTVVVGNCGVGFAPVHQQKEKRDELIALMEGVEDIPGTALWEGLTWNWETFPEYLDELDSLSRKIDVMAHIPHGALRPYVMGSRGIGKENATAKDIDTMAGMVRDALEAGAAGFSTNRTALHVSLSGEPVPGTFAKEEEMLALTRPIGEIGHGVLQVIPDGAVGENKGAYERELEMYRRISLETGATVTFSLAQPHGDLELSDRAQVLIEKANMQGARLIPQVMARPAGYIMGWESMNPFVGLSQTACEVAKLPPKERRLKAAEPSIRKRILSEFDLDEYLSSRATMWPTTYQMLGDYVCEPDHKRSIMLESQRLCIHPVELLYDWLLDGAAQSYFAGYGDGNLNRLLKLIKSPYAIPSLADGGAHVSLMCDGGAPSFMLQHYVRERSGERLGLEQAIQMLSSKPAALYDLQDRGELKKGLRADINVIDTDNIKLRMHETAYDLPLGAPRLLQRADGYVATLCKGKITFRNGVATQNYPGGLLRLGSKC